MDVHNAEMPQAQTSDELRQRTMRYALLACIPGFLLQLGFVTLSRSAPSALGFAATDLLVWAAALRLSRLRLGWLYLPAFAFLAIGSPFFSMPLSTTITQVR